MSKPSFENIERWLFEYTEGNLNPSQIASLESFLFLHPDLDIDLDSWQSAYVTPTTVTLPNADKYKRRSPVLPLFYYSAGAAATIAIAFFTYKTLSNSSGGPLNLKQSTYIHSSHKINTKLSDKVLQRYSENFENVNVAWDEIQGFNSNNLSFQNSFFGNNILVPLNGTQINGILNNTNGNSTSEYLANNAQNQETQTIKRINNGGTKFSSNFNYMEVLAPTEVEKINLNTEINTEVVAYKNRNASHTSPGSATNRNSFMKPFFRKMIRMMDSPLALKNSKDAIYQVPGMQNPQVNFGTVGTLLTSRFQSISRVQNYGEKNEIISETLSFDTYASSIRSGVGIQATSNSYNKGAFKSYELAFLYSPKFKLTKTMTLEPGLQLKMGQKRLTPSKIQSGEMVELDRGNTIQAFQNESEIAGKKLWYKDLGASLMLNAKYFFVGGQVDNLFQHDESIYTSNASSENRAAKHIVLTLGTEYEGLNKKMAVSPYLLYQKKGSLEESWAGANFRFKWLNAGAAISNHLEPAFSLGIKNQRFLLNYQTDFLNSSLLDKKVMSHQLTLRILAKPNRYSRLSKL